MEKTRICKIFFSAALLAAACGCYRKDVRTIEVRVPQLRSEECAVILREAFQKTDGVQVLELNVPERVARVTYDGRKLGIKNVEYIITAAGFEANGQPPTPGAREKLPEGCR